MIRNHHHLHKILQLSCNLKKYLSSVRVTVYAIVLQKWVNSIWNLAPGKVNVLIDRIGLNATVNVNVKISKYLKKIEK